MTWLTDERRRLDAFRQGDAAMLMQVYEVYAPGLARRLARQPLQSPYEITDLVQETFIRAFADEARARYDGVRPFSTYLLTIGRNIAVDRWRTENRRASLREQVADDAEDLHYLQSREADPDQAAMATELRRLYDAFNAQLSEGERTLVQLRFVEDQPRRAVSEATGMSAMRVRILERKLRKRLFEYLVAAGYGAGRGGSHGGGAEAALLLLALLGGLG